MKTHPYVKTILRKLFKVIGWTLISVVLLLIALALLIQLPAVQTKLTQKAVSFLQEKIGTKVSLEGISISFPKSIVLEGLYMEDQSQDTLLYTGRLLIDTDLWGLTRREVELNLVNLENCAAFVHRPEQDTTFNFTYILKAFAGDSTATPDTLEQAGWKFSIQDIELQSVRLQFHDSLSGNLVNVNFGNLNLSMDKFDLETLTVKVDELNLENARVNFVQTKSPVVTKEVAETQPFPFDVGVREVRLMNVRADYAQQRLQQFIRVDLGELAFDANEINLKDQRIDLDKFLLYNSFLAYHQRTVPALPPSHDSLLVESTPSAAGNTWDFSVKKLDLQGNALQYYDFRKPWKKRSFDADHLWISNLNVDAENINSKGIETTLELHDMSLLEKNGFSIQSLSGSVSLTDQSLDLHNLALSTKKSRLKIKAVISFQSLSTITQTYPQSKVNASLLKCKVAYDDILYFIPNLGDSLPIKLNRNSTLNLDAKVTGLVKNIVINHATLSTLKDTKVQMRGAIAGLPDMKHTTMNIDLQGFETSGPNIQAILPDTMLPQTMVLPQRIHMAGHFRGTLENANFKTLLTSDLGDVSFEGKINLDSASATRGYDAQLHVNDFNAGLLLGQPQTMGKVRMKATIAGTGLAIKEMNTRFRGTIEHFEYQNYVYKDLNIDGKVENAVFTAEAKLNDENLAFYIYGSLNYREDIPRYSFFLDLKNSNFKELHIAERPLRARGMLKVDLATADFRSLNGTVDIRKVALYNGEALYMVDSLLFASLDQEGLSEIVVESDILDAKFEGTINLFALPRVLRQYFTTYYKLHIEDIGKNTADQEFNFFVKLKKTELLSGILIPELNSFVPGEISGEFDSKTKKLDMRIEVTEIEYTKANIKSLIVSTHSDQNSLNYNIFADEIMYDSMRVDGLEFNGTVANDSIHTNMIILDSLDIYKYVIGAVFHSLPGEYEIHLIPEEIKLNYETWQVPTDNYVRFGGEKIIAHHLELVNGREKIMLRSNDQNKELVLGFQELNLEYLFSMISQEKPVSGLLHGNIKFIPMPNTLAFTSDIRINNFSVTEKPWGDVALAVERKTADRFNMLLTMQGGENDLRAEGYYLAGKSTSINLVMNVFKFDLSVIEPFSMGQIREAKGLLSGSLNISGTVESPQVIGDLTFKNAAFHSTYVNSTFSLDREIITFNRSGIVLNNFTIRDENKNTAIISGKLATKNYRTYDHSEDNQFSAHEYVGKRQYTFLWQDRCQHQRLHTGHAIRTGGRCLSRPER